jgi:hypothetical protein
MGHVIHRREHVLLSLVQNLRGAGLGELDGGKACSCPGAEVLGGELVSHTFFYGGGHVAGFPALISPESSKYLKTS